MDQAGSSMAGQESGRVPDRTPPHDDAPILSHPRTNSDESPETYELSDRGGAEETSPEVSTGRSEQAPDTAGGRDTTPQPQDRNEVSVDATHSCIMGLLISHHDQLATSKLVERPILRVHVVDAVTGDYLQRPGMSVARFPSERQQQDMLDSPGHDTMTTVYNENLEAFTAVLSHVPATQTQEVPSAAASTVSGKFVWQQELHIDHPFQDTVLNPQAGALLLFELLQHPKSIKQWRRNPNRFAGTTHRVAWAFLDLAHPRTRRATSAAAREHLPAVLDLQLHSYGPPQRCLTD
eukprot:jgi/Ulvmu1/2203/UM013_0049.1